MAKNGTDEVTKESRPFKRTCELCNEYSAHMSHTGLVYQVIYNETVGYHRHVAYCPDLGLRVPSDKVH